MIRPQNPPTSHVDPEAFRAALESGELLTANQAAKLVGISFSTFNYHLHRGHIPTIPSSLSRTYFVTKADAERFARRLKVWREQIDDFDWFLDDETPSDDARKVGHYDSLHSGSQDKNIFTQSAYERRVLSLLRRVTLTVTQRLLLAQFIEATVLGLEGHTLLDAGGFMVDAEGPKAIEAMRELTKRVARDQ